MPRRNHKKLPSHGFCRPCNKDLYWDEIGAQLAFQYLARNPHRGADPPTRYYRCPESSPNQPRFHLTSQPLLGVQEIRQSA